MSSFPGSCCAVRCSALWHAGRPGWGLAAPRRRLNSGPPSTFRFHPAPALPAEGRPIDAVPAKPSREHPWPLLRLPDVSRKSYVGLLGAERTSDLKQKFDVNCVRAVIREEEELGRRSPSCRNGNVPISSSGRPLGAASCADHEACPQPAIHGMPRPAAPVLDEASKIGNVTPALE